MPSPPFVASGDIYPSRFVSISGEFTVAQSVAGDEPVGISCEGTFNAPLPGASGVAASDGDPIQVYGLGEYCLLQSNPDGAGWSEGDLLMPDNDGYGQVIASTANSPSGARALTNNNPGEITRVLVQFHPGD